MNNTSDSIKGFYLLDIDSRNRISENHKKE